ncbi:MAG: uracil-DNA glycosylase [Lysobacter sp.]|nr:uracil-DNA glycosylase [Lysobacter sp.]
MRKPAPIDRFIAALAGFSRPRVFNPWAEFDRANDFGPEAPAIRRDHLRRYLAERVGRARLLLIAEAAGYQGCKFSGIAMTSERQLAASPSTGSDFFEGTKRRTSRETVRPAGFTEPTATIVWGKMLEAGLQGRDWVNWNTFAWHPQGATALANRTPTPQELTAGLPALQIFLLLFPEVPIVAVGDKARGALEELGVPVVAAVRHPANGGATKFREGISRVLASAPSPPPSPKGEGR